MLNPKRRNMHMVTGQVEKVFVHPNPADPAMSYPPS